MLQMLVVTMVLAITPLMADAATKCKVVEHDDNVELLCEGDGVPTDNKTDADKMMRRGKARPSPSLMDEARQSRMKIIEGQFNRGNDGQQASSPESTK
ncbi:hypothetical protein [Geoanaerobacter pelophilus]|uniref:hypothetical protein n=1 Tax=Geoanaerobacter pelophilus TaxID=60036 RepID=UPI001BD9B7E7|nr:hypothetical protein [Geoanaerobacter pelophilus]